MESGGLTSLLRNEARLVANARPVPSSRHLKKRCRDQRTPYQSPTLPLLAPQATILGARAYVRQFAEVRQQSAPSGFSSHFGRNLPMPRDSLVANAGSRFSERVHVCTIFRGGRRVV